jgi:hypothetical protein
LLTKFPACVWLLGSDFVAGAARGYVRRHSPTGPCIAEYGADFPSHMATLPAARSAPYLCAFGELEWGVGQAAIAVTRPALPVAVLADLAEMDGDLTIGLQPALRYLSADWPIDELMRVYLSDCAPERFALREERVHLEISGARGAFAIRRLDGATLALRSRLADGGTLAAAVDAACGVDPAFDAGRAVAALFNEGLVVAVTRQIAAEQRWPS